MLSFKLSVQRCQRQGHGVHVRREGQAVHVSFQMLQSALFSPPADLWVSDEGTYICEAENQFGRIQSRPATITVTGLGKSSAWQWELLVFGQQTGCLGFMSVHADLSVCCSYGSSIQTELENVYMEYCN